MTTAVKQPTNWLVSYVLPLAAGVLIGGPLLMLLFHTFMKALQAVL